MAPQMETGMVDGGAAPVPMAHQMGMRMGMGLEEAPGADVQLFGQPQAGLEGTWPMGQGLMEGQDGGLSTVVHGADPQHVGQHRADGAAVAPVEQGGSVEQTSEEWDARLQQATEEWDAFNFDDPLWVANLGDFGQPQAEEVVPAPVEHGLGAEAEPEAETVSEGMSQGLTDEALFSWASWSEETLAAAADSMLAIN
jgi:hypothetical protein